MAIWDATTCEGVRKKKRGIHLGRFKKGSTCVTGSLTTLPSWIQDAVDRTITSHLHCKRWVQIYEKGLDSESKILWIIYCSILGYFRFFFLNWEFPPLIISLKLLFVPSSSFVLNFNATQFVGLYKLLITINGLFKCKYKQKHENR